MGSMRVILSVGGTWHAPHLAYQLEQYGILETVFSSVPPSRYLQRASIPRHRLHWCPFPELVGPRVAHLLHLPPRLRRRFDYQYAVSFDRTVRSLMERQHLDLFVVFNRFGLETLRLMKRRGVCTVVERASTHSRARERLLDEECERVGVSRICSRLDPRVLERELEEYEVADYISVPSSFAAHSFVAEGIPRSKLIRVPFGVDTDLFQPMPAEHSTFRVITVGNLGLEKGTHYLLSALEKLGIPGTELILVGHLDDYLRARLEETHLRWVAPGKVPQPQLPLWYNSASIFCLPSIQEGLAMVVLEAMACGLPVVVSANTGYAGLIRDGVEGFVVPVRDTEALAEKVALLHREPELRREIGMRARQRAVEFTWNAYGRKIASEYSRVVGAYSGAAQRVSIHAGF